MNFLRQPQHTDGEWRQAREIHAGGQTSPVKSSVHMIQLPGEDAETSAVLVALEGPAVLEDWAALCGPTNGCELSLLIVDEIEAEVILDALQHLVSKQ
jgi:hypothetical protein